MEIMSTAGLPAMGRAAAWEAIYATRMSHCAFVPGDAEDKFDAELRIGQLGPVKLARLTVDRCSVERKPNDIVRHAPRLYSFLLQAHGKSTFFHCGKESVLEEGDFVLCDTGLPHYFLTDNPSVTVMLRVPPAVLRSYLPTPEQFCGEHLGRATGVTSTVAAMVRDLSDGGGSGLSPGYEDRVARYLLEMIAMSYTMGMDSQQSASAVAWQRRKTVIQFIEDNLRDPELSPAGIAASLRVSARYLRTVFAPGGGTMSEYILHRRLEECARQMCNPAWNAHTLTEIAFSWGFNSAAHFTRTFHRKYGMAPREFRKAGLARA